MSATSASLNDYTVTVPEDTDLTAAALTLAATDSKVKSITVNGATYSGGMTLDLSKAATIVVTAENGKTETYTLTAKTGDVTPPKPDEKPSDKYTDIPNDVMGESIKKAIDEGIMVGTSATKFSPNMTVSRWQFASCKSVPKKSVLLFSYPFLSVMDFPAPIAGEPAQSL